MQVVKQLCNRMLLLYELYNPPRCKQGLKTGVTTSVQGQTQSQETKAVPEPAHVSPS